MRIQKKTLLLVAAGAICVFALGLWAGFQQGMKHAETVQEEQPLQWARDSAGRELRQFCYLLQRTEYWDAQGDTESAQYVYHRARLQQTELKETLQQFALKDDIFDRYPLASDWCYELIASIDDPALLNWDDLSEFPWEPYADFYYESCRKPEELQFYDMMDQLEAALQAEPSERT